jgi:hypothetical protein
MAASAELLVCARAKPELAETTPSTKGAPASRIALEKVRPVSTGWLRQSYAKEEAARAAANMTQSVDCALIVFEINKWPQFREEAMAKKIAIEELKIKKGTGTTMSGPGDPGTCRNLQSCFDHPHNPEPTFRALRHQIF